MENIKLAGLLLRYKDYSIMKGLDNAQFGAVVRAGMEYAQSGTEPDFSVWHRALRVWV